MTFTVNSRTRLDLSGPWQLAFDTGGEGIRAGWMEDNWPEDHSTWVQVPALWNITHPNAEGVGFYRKHFTIPTAWDGPVLRLHFVGASYRATVWLNGRYVGDHEGEYTPFDYDVTALAHRGAENQLVVRVAAPSRHREVDGLRISEIPVAKQSWHYTYGGLWGEVYLESRPLVTCHTVRAEPDPRQELVLVEATMSNRSAESRPIELQLQITGPDGSLAATVSAQVSAPPGESPFTFRIPLPRPLLWSCATPHLYQVRVGVSEAGQEVDSQMARFGMREFTVHNGQFFLNGEAIFVRGLLLQPNYPVTLVTPPTPEMMEREITLAQQAGFNLIRTHLRPPPPGFLDLADQMGMMVYVESSLAWLKESPRLLDHGRREVRAMIERDYNHPSVVIWGIHNENRAASVLTSDALVRLARALDPTRVVIDNSGGSMAIDQDFGWVDRATAVPSRLTTRQEIQDVHIYIGAPIAPPVYEWLRTLGISDLPFDLSAHDFGSKAMLDKWNHDLRTYRGQLFVSELGCGGMADLDKVMTGYQNQTHLLDAQEMRAFRDSLHEGFATRSLEQVFGSVRQFVEATQALQAAGLTRQVEALLVNPRISGYLVTHLSDVSWEFHAGLLDHWRDPKPAYHAIKRLNQPHCVILKAATPLATCGDRVDIRLTLVSQIAPPGQATLQVAIYDPLEKEVETSLRLVPAGSGIKELGTIALQAGQSAGEYRVVASLLVDQETLAESTEVVLALPSVDLTASMTGIEFVGPAPDLVGDGQQSNGHHHSRPGTGTDQAPIYLVANPASLTEPDWQQLLDSVERGQVAVIGPLHGRDSLAQRVLHNRGVSIQLHYGIGNWMGCYHWIPASELFGGLPTNQVAGEAYVDVLPRYVLSELGGDVLAGSVRNTQTRREPAAMVWYSDIELVRFGKGALLFCQYRIFDQRQANPLAARMLHNLIRVAQHYRTNPLLPASSGHEPKES
jgi:beta-galactosidase